ncbi:myogenesis-regulating glycosidase-like isoform X2 [Homarus americanus]|uniref:myogenesis-regulating glycosidase-like isoform X2 n=1 Tax=Homarus americanus TaxID=6706 RepID=UPI001C48CE8A|nr:myogenesis-regulating glycosidase-like isoform X2 [Homarus americanus]
MAARIGDVGKRGRSGSLPVCTSTADNASTKSGSPSTAAKRKNRIAELKTSAMSMLPSLKTSSKTDQVSPLGTPIIGRRGHIFTISTPVTEDVVMRPQPQSQKAVPCEGDPFDQRRKMTSAPNTPRQDEEDDKEPVWQRRLSLLFVPPTENELDTEKEEETCQLLPSVTSVAVLPKRLSVDSNHSPALQRKDKDTDTGEENSKRRKEGVSQSENPVVLEKPKPQQRIIFQDTKHEEEEEGTLFIPSYVNNDHNSSHRGIIGGNRGEDTKSKASHASSHNSLSSLIQERMGKPQVTQLKRTRAELGLMVLVAALFIVIVVGITLTSYFYNLHLLELSIFNRIKFYETPRILEIYDATWSPLTTVHLGSNLPDNSIPEDCTHYLHYLKKHNFTMPHTHDNEDYEDMICLDWTGLAQVQLRKLFAQGDVQCYSVWWKASHEGFTLRDCLKADIEHGAWWGGGEMSDGGYPITNANIAPKDMVTGKLGRNSWGQLLRRTWLSERASLLTLPESFNGQVSINYDKDGQICLESGPHPSLVVPLPSMKYNLCTAPNLTSLIYFMHQESINKRKIVAEYTPSLVSLVYDQKEKQTVMNTGTKVSAPRILKEVFQGQVEERVQERLEHPVWVPWMPPDRPQLTQDSVIEYVDNILNQTFGSWGHVLLPASWQAQPGDLLFDQERFPDPATLSQVLKKKGFHLALTLHPFVSVEASAFNNGTKEQLWVRQKNSTLPALAHYDETHPSVVTDFSNPRAKQWFADRLKYLQNKYNIDRFHLQPADAHALPVFHEYHLPLPGPDSVLVHFMAAVSTVSPPVSTEGTITPPLPPTFLTLGTADGSWNGLETLVPRILTLSMLGYPLVDIGPIGGIARSGHVPERELYIRWLEAAAFLPAMQVSVLPDMYDEEVVQLSFEYAAMRKNMVLPRLYKNITGALERGIPLIAPLALYAPDDSVAATVDDQWIVGDDLLVAPIIRRGERTRNIYLPEGIWKDEIDGHLRRGGRWVKNYKVPLTKIPHFTHKAVEDYV